MSILDNLGKSISDAGQKTIAKGKEIAEVTKYNAMILEEEKKKKALYMEIGKKYVELFSDNIDAAFIEEVASIKEAEDKIEEYRQRISLAKGANKCPTCGADVPFTTAFCPSCGTQIDIKKIAAPDDLEEDTETPEAEVTPIDNSEETMECPGCHAVIPKSVKFCTACGIFIPRK